MLFISMCLERLFFKLSSSVRITFDGLAVPSSQTFHLSSVSICCLLFIHKFYDCETKYSNNCTHCTVCSKSCFARYVASLTRDITYQYVNMKDLAFIN